MRGTNKLIEMSRAARVLNIEKYNISPKLCKHCSKILPYDKRANSFCSKSCAAKYNNLGVNRWAGKAVVRTCLLCGKKLSPHSKKYCSPSCRWLYEYQAYVSGWLGGKETGIYADGEVSCHVRRFFMENIGKCERCGWKEINPSTGKSPLHIHHIDGNYENCSRDNLELLCPNCHSITSSYGSLNNGKGRPYYISKRKTK